ncbi:MAG: glycosyltransferase family 39 protein, partial [Actinobacteria bacterium]|nr:glycosyltransferase family 39 protein [Actinomycetota bacterium]
MAVVELDRPDVGGDAVTLVERRARPAAAALLVAALAVAAAVWATVTSVVAFPYLSIDVDEYIYLLQAHTFGAGRLFPPAPSDPEVARSMLPFLTSHSGDVFIPKYSPAWPGVLALVRELTGSYHPAQALVAAGVVVVTYLLALELVRDRKAALVAAAFVVLSPLFLLQSPTFLAYLPNLLLLETFAFAFARAARTGSRATLALAGLVLGIAFFTRPFDALIFALPFGLWLVVARRRLPRRLGADLAVLGLGALPGLAATLAFFYAATGHPLRSPFFVDKHDTFGFGARRVHPEEPLTDYGAPEALQGVVAHWSLLSFWCFGGLVLIGLALFALRRRTSALEPWFALVAVTVPAGYVMFWGSYLMTMLDGPWRIGPFYYLPILVPLAVLGAKGFVRFWTWDRLVAGLAFVGMLAVSGSVAVRALDHQIRRTEDVRRLQAPIEAATLNQATVFVPGQRLLTLMPETRNVSLDQPVLWAVDRGNVANLRVLDAFPGRTAYLLEGGDTPELRALAPQRGDRIPLRVLTDTPAATSAVVELFWRSERYTLPVAGRAELSLTLTAQGTEGMPSEATRDLVVGDTGDL